MTYTFGTFYLRLGTFVLAHRYLVVAFYHICVGQVHTLDLESLFHTYRSIVELHQVRKGFDNELAVQWVLSYRVVPQPKYF